MKTFKKTWLGITAILYVFILVSVVFPAHRALAAGATSKQDIIDCGNSLTFASIAEITCTFKGQTAHFIDPNPSDSGHNDNGYKVNYQPDSAFCTEGVDGLQGKTSFYHPGVTRTRSENNFKVTDAGTTVYVKLNVGYSDASTGQCHQYDQDFSIPPARTKKINTLFAFDGTTDKSDGTSIDTLDAITSSDSPLYGKSFSLVGQYTYNKTTYAFQQDFTPGSCSGEIIMYNKSASAANYFSLNKDNSHTDLGKYAGGSLLDFLNNQKVTGCYIHESKTNFGLGGPFAVAGTPPTPGTVSQTQTLDQTGGQSAQNSPSSCENNAHGFPLAWALCPVLDAASSLSSALIGLFEDQLSFKVADLNTVKNHNSGEGEVRASWALVRDISTSLLVAIMLVMVLSQAISWGPFDAYTIKKLMPKLVVAVILMQISWDLFAYVVGLFDDLGHGLANILYLPFGGASNMDLWHLLGNAHLNGAGGDATLGALDWAAIGVGLFLGYAYVFTMLGMATVAIVSVLAGLFTLVFRKILIIMLLILSPLALAAWILPGTASYWKMWRENFTKALMMFPIAMGIIASGRIFAQVAGTQDNGTFISLIFVLVGYFGPLFILPRTFKWGGQAMQMAGNGIAKAGTKISERPKKFFDTRQEGWTKERSRRSQERMSGKAEYGKWFKFIPQKPILRPLDLMKSGQWDPTLTGRRKFEATTGYQAAGRKSSGETFETAKAAAQQILDTAYDHDQVARDLMRGGEFEYYDKRGRKQKFVPPKGGEGYMRAAGASAIAKYGTDKGYQTFEAELDRMRAEGGEHALLAEEILDDNVEKIKPKNDALYRGFRRDLYQAHLQSHPGDEQGAVRAARRDSWMSSVDSMKETWFDGMEGSTAQGYLAALSQAAADGDPRAEPMMRKLWQTYEEARRNPNIHMSPGVHKAFKAYADGTGLEVINTQRRDEVMDRLRGEEVDENGRVVERVDVTSARRDHPVLDQINRGDGVNQAMIEEVGARELMVDYDENGSEIHGTRDGATGTAPGEIKIQHREAAARILPPPEVLTAGSPTREALKLQLKSDPSAVEAFANRIADLGNSSSNEYHQVLEEMRNDAAIAGTPEATKEYNDIVSKIQQALQQRVNLAAAAASARGRDAAGVRVAGASRIVGLEASSPAPAPRTPGGTPPPDIRKI